MQKGGIAMSIISEVKCARCDRKYSGVRSRCPYCGARRIGRGKYSEESDNSKGKMLIGILIMSVLVIAVGILLFTTPKPENAEATDTISSPNVSQMSDSNDVEDAPGINPITPTPTPTPEPVETTSPQLAVQSVMITYGKKQTIDFTVKVDETVSLGVKIVPVGVEEEIVWKSSNKDVFEVVPLNVEATQAKVRGLKKGTATLTVSVGGVEADCIVRVINKK